MWSHFSPANEHKFIDAMKEHRTFAATRYPSDSLHGHLSDPLYCQRCQKPTSQFLIDSWATVIAQKCLECGHIWLNCVNYSVSTQYHKRLVTRAWDVFVPDTVTTVDHVSRGTRYLQ